MYTISYTLVFSLQFISIQSFIMPFALVKDGLLSFSFEASGPLQMGEPSATLVMVSWCTEPVSIQVSRRVELLGRKKSGL